MGCRHGVAFLHQNVSEILGKSHKIIWLCFRMFSNDLSEAMGWLRLVGSLKLQVSFAKEPYERDDILQKKPSRPTLCAYATSSPRYPPARVCVCMCMHVHV